MSILKELIVLNEHDDDEDGHDGQEGLFKEIKGKVSVDLEGEDDGEIHGSIWVKCDSPDEFHSILKDEDSKVSKFVENTLAERDLSLMGIDDYDDPEEEDGGYIMFFRAYA